MRIPKHLLLALSTGLLLALAWYSPYLAPLIFVAFLPLLFVEQHYSQYPNTVSFSRLFQYSWLSFFVWNLVVLWWLAKASWGGMLLTTVFNSLFYALVFGLFHLSKRRLGAGFGFTTLLFYWLAFEYIHERWGLALPWLHLGQSLGNNPGLIQWYEFTGATGGTVWILLFNIFSFQFIHYLSQARTLKGSVGYLLLLVLLFVSPLLTKSWQTGPRDHARRASVAIIQPNIDPYHDKFNPDLQARHLQQFITMADSLPANTGLIVGPESFLPQGMNEAALDTYPAIESLRQLSQRRGGVPVVVGAMTWQAYKGPNPDQPGIHPNTQGDGFYRAYNTALLVQDDAPVQLYHKNRLMPGTETLPFARLNSWFQQFMPALG